MILSLCFILRSLAVYSTQSVTRTLEGDEERKDRERDKDKKNEGA
jgi:hypothetical protein